MTREPQRARPWANHLLSTVVVLLPNEVIRFPEGGVHIYTVGFMR